MSRPRLSTALILAASFACSCTVTNPEYCDESTPCDALSGRPYCDLAGEHGDRNTCVADPIDAGALADALMPADAALPVIAQVVAGTRHTCALLSTGAVRCWGIGPRLGYGNAENIGDDEPASVGGDVSVGGAVTQLVVGAHTCALLDSGAVRCWGPNDFGQLGYGNTEAVGDDEAPTTAPDVSVGGTVTQIAAGTYHTCALLDTGDVRCWGRGDYGQLGYGATDNVGDDEMPVALPTVDVGGAVAEISAGGFHTCALLHTGRVRCWGLGAGGQLGYGNPDNIGDNETPASAGDVDVGGVVVQVVAGGVHTCALLDTGEVRCWGQSDHGQLGYGSTELVASPTSAGPVWFGADYVERISAGGAHTCVLLDTGAVRCWGLSEHGQLGYGNTASIGDDEVPASAGDVRIGGTVVQIAAGGAHTCVRLTTNNVRCWGDGAAGRLGYGSVDSIGDDEHPEDAGDVPIF